MLDGRVFVIWYLLHVFWCNTSVRAVDIVSKNVLIVMHYCVISFLLPNANYPVNFWGQAKFGINLLKSSEQIFDCSSNNLPLSALFIKNGQKERVTQLSVIKELVACCYVTNHWEVGQVLLFAAWKCDLRPQFYPLTANFIMCPTYKLNYKPNVVPLPYLSSRCLVLPHIFSGMRFAHWKLSWHWRQWANFLPHIFGQTV